jgi:hypothetical protein
MTIQVELSPEVEARLAADAGVRGMALEQYVGKLLAEAATAYASGTGRLTREEFRAMRDELTRGSRMLPILPPEATERASFYEDRW